MMFVKLWRKNETSDLGDSSAGDSEGVGRIARRTPINPGLELENRSELTSDGDALSIKGNGT